MRIGLAGMVILATVACGDATAPEGDVVTGVWAYSATGLQGSGLDCVIRDVTLTFTQSGQTLSGSSRGGTFECTFQGTDAEPVALVAGSVSGSINADSVRFTVTQGTNSIVHAGRMAASASLTGTVVATLDLGPPLNTVQLTGTFAASRQP